MRLLFATDEFEIAGIQREGFPLLIDAAGELVEPFFSYLIHHLLHQGGVQSSGSWTTYGYALLHFLRFLDEKDRKWDERPKKGVPSVVADYRTWARIGGASPRTISDRLDLVCNFYEFALEHGFVKQLPFAYEDKPTAVRGKQMPGAERATKPVADVKFKVPKRRLKVLSVSEVAVFLKALGNPVHRLMARLQLATGIRVEELVTFPARYVFDPRTRPDARHFFAVRLDPSQMATKGSVERVIHMPRDLMADLWAYASLERNRRAAMNGNQDAALFLTEEGKSFETRSVWAIYSYTYAKTGVHVNPHALRHTYAWLTSIFMRPPRLMPQTIQIGIRPSGFQPRRLCNDSRSPSSRLSCGPAGCAGRAAHCPYFAPCLAPPTCA